MEEKEFLQNVNSIIKILLKNAGQCFGINFMVVNETAIEVDKRIKELKRNKKSN